MREGGRVRAALFESMYPSSGKHHFGALSHGNNHTFISSMNVYLQKARQKHRQLLWQDNKCREKWAQGDTKSIWQDPWAPELSFSHITN